jgi:hypothetical protein
MAAIMIALLALWTIVAVKVARDAENHEIGRPPLWGAGVFLCGLLVLLPYLFVRYRHVHRTQVTPVSS